MDTYLVKAYPGYANLESIDGTNWPIWLLSFVIGFGIFCAIIFIYMKWDDIVDSFIKILSGD